MADYTILHNPRCRKSREALQLLEKKGIKPEVRLYLNEPLSAKELKSLFKLLNVSPEEGIRKVESVFKENFKGKKLTENQWLEAIEKHPKLLERPVVIKDNKKAVIGRPPEKVLELV